MSDAPIIPGSDAWFQKIADILTGSTGGSAPASDAAIAALITSLSSLTNTAVRDVVTGQVTGLLGQAESTARTLDTQLRAVLVDLFVAGDTATLSSANAYTDQQVAGAGVSENYVDDSSARAVVTANAYTDDAINSQATDDRTYVDGALATAAAVSSSYADAGDTATGAAANTYTDAQIDFIFTSLTTLMDNKDTAVSATTLQAAIDYVTAHPGGGASSAYVDNGDASTLSAAKTYADNGDATNLATAKTYADGRYTAANTYADNKDVTNLTAAKTYADNGDAATLAAAKTYADGKVSDTGWIALPLGAGFTGSDTPSYRKINGVVYLRGQYTYTAAITTGLLIGTLPTGFRPIGPHTFFGMGANVSSIATNMKIAVNADGTINTGTPSGSTTFVRLDGLAFPAA